MIQNLKKKIKESTQGKQDGGIHSPGCPWPLKRMRKKGRGGGGGRGKEEVVVVEQQQEEEERGK